MEYSIHVTRVPHVCESREKEIRFVGNWFNHWSWLSFCKDYLCRLLNRFNCIDFSDSQLVLRWLDVPLCLLVNNIDGRLLSVIWRSRGSSPRRVLSHPHHHSRVVLVTIGTYCWGSIFLTCQSLKTRNCSNLRSWSDLLPIMVERRREILILKLIVSHLSKFAELLNLSHIDLLLIPMGSFWYSRIRFFWCHHAEFWWVKVRIWSSCITYWLIS